MAVNPGARRGRIAGSKPVASAHAPWTRTIVGVSPAIVITASQRRLSRWWLRPPQFEDRDGADSGGLACVLGKAWVAPRLLGVDAVAFGTGQFADGHLVRLGSAF